MQRGSLPVRSPGPPGEGRLESHTSPGLVEEFTYENASSSQPHCEVGIIITTRFIDGETQTQRSSVICAGHTMKKWRSWDMRLGHLAQVGAHLPWPEKQGFGAPKNKEVSGECKLCDLERRAVKQHYIGPDRQSAGEGGVWRRAGELGRGQWRPGEERQRQDPSPLLWTACPHFFPKCQPEEGPSMRDLSPGKARVLWLEWSMSSKAAGQQVEKMCTRTSRKGLSGWSPGSQCREPGFDPWSGN